MTFYVHAKFISNGIEMTNQKLPQFHLLVAEKSFATMGLGQLEFW